MKEVSPRILLSVLIRRLIFPLIIYAFLSGFYFIYRVKPDLFLENSKGFIKNVFLTLFILNTGFSGQRLFGGFVLWYKDRFSLEVSSRFNKEFLPLIRRSVNTVIWTIAILVILPLYGINVNSLIAALGVGSLAVALAAQDTIANIIAGFMIMIDRPFRIGDRIKLPSGEKAVVLDIGIRRSKFFCEDNRSVIIVPNLELSKNKIVNFTYGEFYYKDNYYKK